MDIEQIKFNNSDIDMVLCENQMLWSNKVLVEVKRSWNITDDFFYVNSLSISNGKKIFLIKNSFVNSGSTGLLVYEQLTGIPFVNYYIKKSGQWLSQQTYTFDIGAGKSLHFSETPTVDIGLLNIQERGYSLIVPSYNTQKLIFEKTKMYYFEFDRQISGSKKLKIMNEIATNWKNYKG